MITEDYVSFETAKLLKEKGFDGECSACYEDYEDYSTSNSFHNGFKPTDFNSIDPKILDIISAPTLQMAIKWLREVYRLHITIFSSSQESWMFRITKQHQNLEDGVYGEDFCTYEEACEAAIKYCLENLI